MADSSIGTGMVGRIAGFQSRLGCYMYEKTIYHIMFKYHNTNQCMRSLINNLMPYMSILKAVIWMVVTDKALMTKEDSWTNSASNSVKINVRYVL